ncbi:MAG: cytochrome c biogenesis protein CcsA [Candidatus Latescibacterota bacterium]|nr:MAG: cytochrome c biogenesis protein CcsA [Candidatus Latescibacterota bacterium]
MTTKPNKDTAGGVLNGLALIAMIVSLYMVFLYVPTEATMGDVQRIFYFHVPLAWVSFFGFFLVFVFSVGYLVRANKKWDNLAASSAEIGVLYCTLVLVTGPIWAKPVWGVWWTWDPRLTLTLVLWLIYIAYLMLRHYMVDPERKATFSAVLGVVGFIDVPLVYFSIRWWRTQHPQPVMAGGEDSGLEDPMVFTLVACVVAFMLLFFALLRHRLRHQAFREELDELHDRLEHEGHFQ